MSRLSKKKLVILLILACFLVLIFINSSSDVAALVTDPPPGISSNNEYFKKGYLDVTLYGADPTGQQDSTQAIQEAVNYARDYQLATFFPNQQNGERGVYLVSDTIWLMMDYWWIFYEAEPRPNVLIGSTKGQERPIIKLQQNAAKFSNSSSPMPVFWFWATPGPGMPNEGSTDPLYSQDDVSFNQIFKGIDIDLSGNPGAYGIRHAGCQGSAIEDTRINATGAFAGIGKFGVLGWAAYNVEVEGGKYGVYVNPSQEYTFIYGGHGIIIGSTFKNQEEAVLYLKNIAEPILLAGFHIVRNQGVMNIGNVDPWRGGISLVDGLIEMNGGQMFDDGQNFYMRDVYIKGADSVANNWNINDKNSWTQIKEYVYAAVQSQNLINGDSGTNEYRSKEENVNVTQDQLINSLVKKHQWDETSFPSFEDTDAVNVKQLGAKGDGQTDDTNVLKNAIANYDKIFIPKGNYLISETLTLKKDTQMFGVSDVFSKIIPHSSWNPSGETIILTTADDRDAHTSLSFLGIYTDMNLETSGINGFTPIEWRAGRNSIMRNVMAGSLGEEWNANLNYHRFRINGHGGGKHFGLVGRWAGNSHDNNRSILIEGTEEPLYIYAPNSAWEPANITTEIKNSKNVQLYWPSHEMSLTCIRIDHSQNVSVFAGHKNGNIGYGRGGIEVFESNDVLVSNFVPINAEGANQHALKEIHNGATYLITNDANVALFKRGEPDFTPIGNGGSSPTPTPTPPPSPYDLDGNGEVGIGDVLVLLGNWRGGGQGDFNGDSKVNGLDFGLLSQTLSQ